MQSSAPSTEARFRRPGVTGARGGFTLLEASIAMAILSIMLALALSQLTEGTEATRTTTVQADLRRQSEDLLSRIQQDVLSTQTRFFGAATSNGTTGDIPELYKVTGFDCATAEPTLDGGGAPPGASTTIYQYRVKSLGGSSQTDALVLCRGNQASLAAGTANEIELSRELAKRTDVASGGFLISTSQGLPGLLSSALGRVDLLGDTPTIVQIRLVFKRRVGKHKNNNDWSVLVQSETNVILRASQAY